MRVIFFCEELKNCTKITFQLKPSRSELSAKNGNDAEIKDYFEKAPYQMTLLCVKWKDYPLFDFGLISISSIEFLTFLFIMRRCSAFVNPFISNLQQWWLASAENIQTLSNWNDNQRKLQAGARFSLKSSNFCLL